MPTQEVKVKSLENARAANPQQVQMISQLETNDILEELLDHFKAQKQDGIEYPLLVTISGTQSNLFDDGNPYNLPNLPWFSIDIRNDGPNNIVVGINQEINPLQAPIRPGEGKEVRYNEALIRYFRIACYQSGVASPSATLRIFGAR